jgi:hypothetical protein
MRIQEVGRIQGYLIRHRQIGTKSERGGVDKEEREIAISLRDAGPETKALLRQLFEGQGLVLHEFGESDVKGTGGGTVFVLARSPESKAPFFGYEQLISNMKQNNDTQADAKTWFVHIWFVLLDLFYTSRQRGPSEMQGYVDTTFTTDVLVQSVRKYLYDHVRKIDRQSILDTSAYETLLSEKKKRLERYCSSFLELMLDARLIERRGVDTYRQSLLSAYEMKLNFDRQLALLLPSATPIDAAHALLITPEDA